MRKKTITVLALSSFTLLSVLLGQKYWAGLGLGLLLVLTNDWLLSFSLRWMPAEGILGSLRRVWGWITPVLYLVKQGVFFVALYFVFRTLDLDLKAFVLGILGYQGYRLVLMIFMPERYLQSIFGVSPG
ncbi:MAG: hypothetical protein OEV76_07330, partial [Anaerolineae bacterium]|nr:hypothetical protein [Anaerolineae bacterium]